MAEADTVPETTTADPVLNPNQQDSDHSTLKPSIQFDVSFSPLTPLPNPSPDLSAPPPPSIHPSFRPAVPLVPVPSAGSTPMFSSVPLYQNLGVPPPGVSAPPQVVVPPVQHGLTPHYAMGPLPLRYPMPLPNGYPLIPQNFPQGSMPYPVHS